FDCLLYLIEQRHRSVGKEELLQKIWEGRVVSDTSLSTCIKSVRQAVGDDGRAQQLVKTLPKVGFRFVGNVRLEQASAVTPPLRDLVAMAHEIATLPTIAVLPFGFRAAEPSSGWDSVFADGLAEDIIAGLSRFKWLRVMARGTTFAFKPPFAVQDVAAELQVRFVLEGHVTLGAESIRVTAQLVDAKQRSVIWADNYDELRDGLFEVRDGITDAIVQAIAPQIDGYERQRVLRTGRTTLDAWSLYQRGLASYYLQTSEGLRAAASLFDDACQSDLGFATAFAYAAASRNRLVLNYNPSDRDTLLLAARTSLSSAFALDANDPTALAVAGVLASIEDRHDIAIAHVEGALNVNPNCAYTWGLLAFVRGRAGAYEDALRASTQAMQLSPRDPAMAQFLMVHCSAFFGLGRYIEAIEWGRKAVFAPSPFPGAHVYLAVALLRLGRRLEAREVVAQLHHRFPGYGSKGPSRVAALIAELDRAGLNVH
ncbi:MAG: winged helix-turn-helix domain-containing protein, partial [Gammaproteobacteria bacterium]|nr:winged helix-turn-helix domain-containing protein [Gammaproteobacteria bacterium]